MSNGMKTARDQYGETVTIHDIRGNVAYTNRGTYHTTKLYNSGGRNLAKRESHEPTPVELVKKKIAGLKPGASIHLTEAGGVKVTVSLSEDGKTVRLHKQKPRSANR